MSEANSSSRLAGSAGTLMALVGLLVFFAGVFSIGPRMFLFVGIALYVLALAAFYVEELGQRRTAAGK